MHLPNTSRPGTPAWSWTSGRDWPHVPAYVPAPEGPAPQGSAHLQPHCSRGGTSGQEPTDQYAEFNYSKKGKLRLAAGPGWAVVAGRPRAGAGGGAGGAAPASVSPAALTGPSAPRRPARLSPCRTPSGGFWTPAAKRRGSFPRRPRGSRQAGQLVTGEPPHLRQHRKQHGTPGVGRPRTPRPSTSHTAPEHSLGRGGGRSSVRPTDTAVQESMGGEGLRTPPSGEGTSAPAEKGPHNQGWRMLEAKVSR